MADEPVRAVRTSDEYEVLIDAALWEASPVLRDSEQDDQQPFEVNCTKETVDDLLSLHCGKDLPSDLRRTYDLLTLTMELQLEDLARLCLKHLFRIADFWRVNYPDYIPDEVVLACFKESLNRLFRTNFIYGHEVREITKLHRSDRQTTLVLTALVNKTREFAELKLDPVPIFFSWRCVPIFLINKRGKPKTAIYISSECTPFELFGRHFDASKVDIDAFYLKYASYVLFKSRRKVFWKDLRQSTEARQMKENCTFLISREDAVFIVTEEDSECLIWEWIENEEHDGSFALIHRTPDKISSLDFDPSSSRRLLILKEDGRLSTAELKNHELVSIRGISSDVRAAWFYGSDVVAFRNVSDEEGEIEMQHLILGDASGDRVFNQFNSDGFKALVESGRVLQLSQVLCRISPDVLRMYDIRMDDALRVLLDPEQYLATSELLLHP